MGTNPSITSEWPCAHIWSCKTTSYNRIRKALRPRPSIPGNWPCTSIPRMVISLTSDHVVTNLTVISKWFSTHIWDGRNQSSHHDRMVQPLHLTMEGTNPLTMSEWLTDSSLPLGRNLDLENTKLLPKVLKLHSVQWLHQHISYLFIHHNILDLWSLISPYPIYSFPLYTISLI